MNMQAIMAQAQKMQRDINSKKDALDKQEFVGKSEWIELTFNGAKEIKNVKVLYEGIIEESDKEILEDMIEIAIKDAMSKINKEFDEKMGQYSNMLGGLM